MKRSNTGWLVTTTACLMMISVALAPVATADGSVTSADSKPFIADDLSYVILDVTDSIETQDGQFYPTGDLPPEALIAFRDADGNLPGGLTEEGLARLLEMKAQSLIGPDQGGALELSPELVALANGG